MTTETAIQINLRTLHEIRINLEKLTDKTEEKESDDEEYDDKEEEE